MPPYRAPKGKKYIDAGILPGIKEAIGYSDEVVCCGCCEYYETMRDFGDVEVCVVFRTTLGVFPINPLTGRCDQFSRRPESNVKEGS